MNKLHRLIVLSLLVLFSAEPTISADFPPIPRIIPPPGIDVPADDVARLEKGIQALGDRLGKAKASLSRESENLLPDVEVYLKAVRFAVENGEFFDLKEIGRADQLLKQGNDRLDELLSGKHSWTAASGLVVRGYRSELDDSVQPYGLVIPKDLDLSKPVPLYVWLHGRGDKMCDLQFIHQRQTSAGQISPPNAIVLHPFGRYCNGFKFAGEKDVQESLAHTQAQYTIDADRIVLWGFSMGGAGAWHLGAHYPSQWVAVSPGAGFAETARYQRLDPASLPGYERTLWGMYDVPNYVRNLFNVPVIAYSGENDKQIQAARVMEEAYAQHGHTLKHLIGPGVEHKYEPATLAALEKQIAGLVAQGNDRSPKKVSLQTQTLRYSKVKWVHVARLDEHWREATVDAAIETGTVLTVATRNVAEVYLNPRQPVDRVVIDGQSLKAQRIQSNGAIGLVKQETNWSLLKEFTAVSPQKTSLTGFLCGPIDDAFLERFLVVLPTTQHAHAAVGQWVQAEVAHFRERWKRLFRGELRVKNDIDVTEADLRDSNLVLWGDPKSNRLIAKVIEKLPIQWNSNSLTVGTQSFAAASHVPALIYPSPLADSARYIVLNSGITFREGHDRSNSLQTPKLPDWAVIDLSQQPDQFTPGKIAAAGFFDEQWQLKPSR